jgi:hypothetical protein
LHEVQSSAHLFLEIGCIGYLLTEIGQSGEGVQQFL